MVPFNEYHAHFVIYYLHYIRLPVLEEKRKHAGTEKFHIIVYGNHRHAAIILLMDTDDTMINFKRSVTYLRTGYSPERYQKLVGMQNERHLSLFYAGFTFADVTCNLKMEYDCLLFRRETIALTNMPKADTVGCEYESFSSPQRAQTAIKFPRSAISTITDIGGKEEP